MKLLHHIFFVHAPSETIQKLNIDYPSWRYVYPLKQDLHHTRHGSGYGYWLEHMKHASWNQKNFQNHILAMSLNVFI